MAQEKKRFVFDDEESEVIDSVVVEEPSNPTNIKIDEPQDEKKMKKKGKNKKKFRLRIWHIVLLVFVLIVGGFVTYIFIATNNDGPVYGDRCKALIGIDDSKFDEVERQMVADERIESVEISKACRTIEIVITYNETVGTEDAEALAQETLLALDTALGQEKENPEDLYSKVFGEANGRGQYNVSFRLRTTGENADFPIFGTKQPRNTEISFTKATPANQETTDQVNSSGEQENTDEGTQQ